MDKNNIRSSRCSVELMKKEIISGLSQKVRSIGYRKVEPQLQEAYNFISMIEKPPYQGCATVGYLKHRIVEERNLLKDRLAKLEVNLPGYQFSLFEMPQPVSECQQEEIMREIQWLEGQIRWLHKCLGMASNRNYFK